MWFVHFVQTDYKLYARPMAGSVQGVQNKDNTESQGLKSIGIVGSAIPGRQAFGRKEGAFPCASATRKILGLLTHREEFTSRL